MFENLITDRKESDVSRRTDKGHYNSTDLNRVEEAAEQMADILSSRAYPVNYLPHYHIDYVTNGKVKGWLNPEDYDGVPDHPTQKEMARYFKNITEIKRQFYQKNSTPKIPDSMEKLTFDGANAIEQLIIDTNDLFDEMKKETRPSGTFKAGEIL